MLTKVQKNIVAAMRQYGFTFIRYYGGPPGAPGLYAGFFWPRGDRHAETKLPKLHAASVDGLIKRGILRSVGDGDYELANEYRQNATRTVLTFPGDPDLELTYKE